MRRRGICALGVAVMLAGLVMPFLTGCGGEADPFVGTWQLASGTQPEAPTIIAKKQDGYSVAWFNPVKQELATLPATFTRQGNKLAGTFSDGSNKVTWGYIYLPQSGHLNESSTGFLGLPATSRELSRVSDSTEYPSGQ
jgi:hypothetical protein